MNTPQSRPPSGRPWAKGQSGNPRGRAAGQTPTGRLRAAIGSDLPAIVDRLKVMALAGDVGAARTLLDRVLPVLRPVDADQQLTLPTDASEAARCVAAALAQGTLSADRARGIVGALDAAASLADVAELVRRITALEARFHDRGQA